MKQTYNFPCIDCIKMTTQDQSDCIITPGRDISTISPENVTCDTENNLDMPVILTPPLIETNLNLAIIYISILSAALLIGTFGNVMILTVARWARGLNKVGKPFMVNLALADFCVSAIADPMCIVGVIKGHQFFNGLPWLCHFIASLCLTACFCAFMSLTMLSINRYMYLCHNTVYDRLYGRKTCIALCLVCWIVAFLCEFPNFTDWGGHYFDQKNHQCIWDRTSSLSYTLFVAIGLIGFPLGLMTVCYFLIFRHIWNTKKNLFNIDFERPERMGKIMTETARQSKTLMAIFMVFVVCWTPYAVTIIIDFGDRLSMELHLMVTLLAHLHSSCNFIIYLVANKRFRTALARIYGCRKVIVSEDVSKDSHISSIAGIRNTNFVAIRPQSCCEKAYKPSP